VSSQLSELRKHVLHGRDVLDQLASHHSEFIPITTQPYLQKMVGSMDRITRDLSTERETVAESLTLYMGMVAHRTNRLLQRLTIFSVIFLPLTFICGIYGTNFPLPEYEWSGGIMFFWGVLILIATCMLTLLRLRRIW
jgi:magnesium transporter